MKFCELVLYVMGSLIILGCLCAGVGLIKETIRYLKGGGEKNDRD